MILYFSLPSTSKKNTINKSTGIPFKKKKKQSTECKATSWGVTYIFTGERGWRGLRGVTEGSITKYTKVLFLFFTVHKRTRPHSQMRHYKINRYLLYNFWSILYRCMTTNMSHKCLFGNVYRRAQLGISACSGGDVRAERECGGQSCGTATLTLLNQAEACFHRSGDDGWKAVVEITGGGGLKGTVKDICCV